MRSPYRPRRILIAGATGTIGSAILPSLAGFGVPMRVLLHHRALGVPLAGPPSLDDPGPRPTIEVARGDLARSESIRGIAEGCDVLVHAAARTGFAGLARDAQRRVNVEGTEALLREAQSAGVRIFVLIGYTGTVLERDERWRGCGPRRGVGDRPGEWRAPILPYGRLSPPPGDLRAAERDLRRARAASKTAGSPARGARAPHSGAAAGFLPAKARAPAR